VVQQMTDNFWQAEARSELLALKWRDVDLELACIYVSHSLYRLDDGTIIIKEPKTSRSRRPVDLPLSLVTLLRQHQVAQEVQRLMLDKSLTEDDFVFIRPDGSPINPNAVTLAFRRIIKKAMLKDIRIHDLRHTHATLMPYKAGVHPKVVSERLGHANIDITLDIYSHVLPGLQEAAAEKFDRIFEGEANKNSDPSVSKMSARRRGLNVSRGGLEPPTG
jgi:integrase